MRIIIDLQGAQTQSRYRGIGRYALSLTLAMVRNAGEHEIWLVLNASFTQSVIFLRNQFKDLIPKERILAFQIPENVAEHNPENSFRARSAEIIRELAIEKLNPDFVCITSLFEGFVDDAVTSIGVFDKSTRVAVVLYDLIPYLNPNQYLSSEIQKNYYKKKIQSLKNADLLLSISDSTRDECIKALNYPKDKILSISSAVDSIFHKKDISKEELSYLREKYKISKKIILYAPGGFDERKNFDNLIYAYGKLQTSIREQHQLVLASQSNDEEKASLLDLANKAGLRHGEMIITGYVSEEMLIVLYNLAVLFVFPSKHEGFGLPALEAMACGTPTIASNTTSLPEVIGLKEALFDPFDIDSIADKMEQVITNESFAKKLKQHALTQASLFSWDLSAKKALAFLEENVKKTYTMSKTAIRYKLAYFSPFPPARSGISDYSRELIEYLCIYYDITLIVEPNVRVSKMLNLEIQSSCWFLENYQKFDRILYHVGNSPYHSYMLPILRQYSGIVVMHDFFMSGMLAYEEISIAQNQIWTQSLYYSHGYKSLKEKCGKNGIEIVKEQYPCNLEIMQNAMAIIGHSPYSNDLLYKWYGNLIEPMHIIPLLRNPSKDFNKNEIRTKLNIPTDAFIICSFGFIDPSKITHQILEAFLNSRLVADSKNYLIFVGENNGGEYGVSLLNQIKKAGLENRICITGWVSTETYQDYLMAADVGVQLRALSRGETSAAVLDCMNYGLATIVNATGSMAYLPKSLVLMHDEILSTAALIESFEYLEANEEERISLGSAAKEFIKTNHSPQKCASLYYDVIEQSYAKYSTLQKAIDTIADLQNESISDKDLFDIATSLAYNIRAKGLKKQLLVDVSSIVNNDLGTGIERVIRAQLIEFLENPPQTYAVEPVYLFREKGRWHYRYARTYTCKIMNITKTFLKDEIIEVSNGDIFYCADFSRDCIIDAVNQGLFNKMKILGVNLNFVIYDILPILYPRFFPEGSNERHKEWLDAIASVSDNLICISEAVANEVKVFLKQCELKISYNHLGADIQNSSPSFGIPANGDEMINTFKSNITFLMVGTIEPRKGYVQVLEAFEKLWSEGYEINLVIVGKEGWKLLCNSERRTIPQIISRMHEMKNQKRFFWLEGISDEYLEKVYAVSSCLIAASEAEGFGLPLIEAAHHKKPIIARDIPVFREVAGDAAYFFENSNDPKIVQSAIKEWLSLLENNQHIKSDAIALKTWQESTKQLLNKILEGKK